jgi:hypothetical protein
MRIEVVLILIVVTPLLKDNNKTMAPLSLISEEREEYKKHGFSTAINPYILLMNNYSNSVKALITSGDVIPNVYISTNIFANIPDILRSVTNNSNKNSNTIGIFNHESGSDIPFELPFDNIVPFP